MTKTIQKLLIFITLLFSIHFTAQNTVKLKKDSTTQKEIDYQKWTALLHKHVSREGLVNYKGLKKDSVSFNKFLNTLSNTHIDNSWNIKDKVAFWINVYNAYTIKLIIDNYPVSSIKKINKPWDKPFFNIDGKNMNLSEVEHEILRKFGDARIHFAINCASLSCPKLTRVAYTSNNLEQLLEHQTKEFINDSFFNEISTDSIKISKLFSWYRKDFKSHAGSVNNFINQYSNVKIEDQKRWNYKNYNWAINEDK